MQIPNFGTEAAHICDALRELLMSQALDRRQGLRKYLDDFLAPLCCGVCREFDVHTQNAINLRPAEKPCRVDWRTSAFVSSSDPGGIPACIA